MARKAKVSEDIVETDRVAGQPHPRETFRLCRPGRSARPCRARHPQRAPPQGWLIGGPPGIGKATLAYRIARYLLRYGATASRTGRSGRRRRTIPSSLQVKAGAHPGLLVLKRGVNPDTGKLMTVLAVDEIRKLGGFFGMTSGAGGWRVAIVDTCRRLERCRGQRALEAAGRAAAARNASSSRPCAGAPAADHPFALPAPAAAPPATMRNSTSELAHRLPDLSPQERAHLARLSGGSIGAALRLAGDEGLMLASEAEQLIDRAARPMSRRSSPWPTGSDASMTASTNSGVSWVKPCAIASARGPATAHRVSIAGSRSGNGSKRVSGAPPDCISIRARRSFRRRRCWRKPVAAAGFR